jgi:hypothetical protein
VSETALNFLSDLVGFVSSGALAWQALRLVRHLRGVRDLRQIGERTAGTRTGELAEQGAASFEEMIARWDARDQWFVFIGVAGIAVSFLLKLAAVYVAWRAATPCHSCG